MAELLNKAEKGNLQQEELAYISHKIQEFQESQQNREEIHSLLQMMGYAGAFSHSLVIPKYKALIEKLIIFPQDPMVTVTALDILCNDWGLTRDYINQIKSFVKGVEWDTDEDVRVKAMGLAGEYARETGDRECLKLLLEIFENAQEKKIIREIAYHYICRAIGKSFMEIQEINMDDFSRNPLAQETIMQAYQILNH